MSKPSRIQRACRHALSSSFVLSRPQLPGRARRSLATAQHAKRLSSVWFNGSDPWQLLPGDGTGSRRAPDERTLKLGKTLRILQDRLPTLLQSPLPSEILSPHISLHLFPSTHPHLPAVSGRVAYIAALWSSPIAWGRVPIVGNVKLEILSERMVRKSTSTSPIHYSSASSASMSKTSNEQLVVRWRTLDKTQARSGLVEKITITEFLGGKGEDEFTGLFIFDFDESGRIITHTIEHVQEGGNWEKGVGAKVVGLTDWLLGGLRGKREDGTPCPVCCTSDQVIPRK